MGAVWAVPLAVLLSASGASAQGTSAAAIAAWDLFAGFCPVVAEDVNAARRLADGLGGELQAGASADGSVVQGTVVMDDMVIGESDRVIFIYGAEAPEGGRIAFCQLQVIGEFGTGASAPLPDLATVAAARAGELLGADHLSHGGPMVSLTGERAALHVFHTAGFPPALTIRVQRTGPLAMLQLTRLAPAEGN